MKLGAVEQRTPSPDGSHELIIHDCRESTMGRYDARVALLDARGELVDDFAPLLAQTSAAGAWSPDSRHLAFASAAREGFFYLVSDVAAARFGVVRIGNPYPLEMEFPEPGVFKVSLRESQLAAVNAQEVFGGERAEFPIRRFRASEPLVVQLASLAFHDRAQLAEIDGLLAREPAHDVGFVPDGYFPYDGPPLTSTMQRCNGRPLAIVHLEAFAESGDALAQEWLDEALARVGAKGDRWQAVAGLIGKRSR